MAENKTETKTVMLTIKQAAALVDGLTEFRVRELCKYVVEFNSSLTGWIMQYR